MNGTKNKKTISKIIYYFVIRLIGVVHMCDEVEDTIGVASFVIIPRY